MGGETRTYPCIVPRPSRRRARSSSVNVNHQPTMVARPPLINLIEGAHPFMKSARSEGVSKRARCRRHNSSCGLPGRSRSKHSRARQSGQAYNKTSPAVPAVLCYYKMLGLCDCQESDNGDAQCHMIALSTSNNQCNVAKCGSVPELLIERRPALGGTSIDVQTSSTSDEAVSDVIPHSGRRPDHRGGRSRGRSGRPRR